MTARKGTRPTSLSQPQAAPPSFVTFVVNLLLWHAAPVHRSDTARRLIQEAPVQGDDAVIYGTPDDISRQFFENYPFVIFVVHAFIFYFSTTEVFDRDSCGSQKKDFFCHEEHEVHEGKNKSQTPPAKPEA